MYAADTTITTSDWPFCLPENFRSWSFLGFPSKRSASRPNFQRSTVPVCFRAVGPLRSLAPIYYREKSRSVRKNTRDQGRRDFWMAVANLFFFFEAPGSNINVKMPDRYLYKIARGKNWKPSSSPANFKEHYGRTVRINIDISKPIIFFVTNFSRWWV